MTRTLKRWVTALARRMGVDANPLRRGCDRAEGWVRLGLVVVFLVASPLAAIALGHLTNDASIRAARAQAATEHWIPAVLLQRVSRNPNDPLAGTTQEAWTQAKWTAPDGRQRRDEIPAPVGSRAGRVVHIWVDEAGDLVYGPIGQGQIASRVIAVVALTPAILAVVLLGVAWLTGRLLDRRRMVRWAAEWSAVEPRWTKRNH
ncbi:MAG: Rv1733c family protein [Streptosporangiaceae bacterium]